MRPWPSMTKQVDWTTRTMITRSIIIIITTIAIASITIITVIVIINIVIAIIFRPPKRKNTRRLLVSVVTMRPLCTVLAGAGADGVAEGAAATQCQTPSNSPVHGEPDAEAIGPAGGLVVDAPPAPSARGPVFEVLDSPPPDGRPASGGRSFSCTECHWR